MGVALRIEEVHLKCPPDPQLKPHHDGGDRAHLDRYLSQNVIGGKGGELSIAQVHQRYCEWCSQRGIAPVSKANVGRRMAASPYDWRTLRGYRIYVDVKFAG